MTIVDQYIKATLTTIQDISHRVRNTKYFEQTELTALEKELALINETILKLFIESFKDMRDSALFDFWCKNYSIPQFRIALHKQSGTPCVSIKPKRIPFWMVFESIYTIDPIYSTQLSSAVREHNVSNSVLKRIIREAFKNVPECEWLPIVIANSSTLHHFKTVAPTHTRTNPFRILMNFAIPGEYATYNISRHPSWCSHNIDKKCDIFGAICHTSVNCPFFNKVEKIAPNTHRYKIQT